MAAYAIAMDESSDKDSVLELAVTDHTVRAKILLLQLVQQGVIPKGFEASVVRTNHSCGHRNAVKMAAVSRKHFLAHPKLKVDPVTLPGSKMEQRPFDVITGEFEAESCIAMKICTVPDDLPWTEIEVFYQESCEWVEFHLTKDQHLREGQALPVFNQVAKDSAHERPQI